ncbi:site-specific DNA-methyltransferase [Zhongshania sp. BJYM1]|uniref:site-specific DNA-methyltransferase n=1 Tax=Zhongshania aquatica TaxID=2965069 RepID=UPI0022B30CDE|nr:DNA methyltransferase [Marortus sp. BJYM1]
MSRLTDLIAQAKSKDPQLGQDLEREIKTLSSRLPFGLNFERHRPEVVELPLRPIRKGDKVRVLPERGSTKSGDARLWQVKTISGRGKAKVADLELVYSEKPETQSVSLDDLIVVAEFRDVIYPGLISTGKVERGGDKPYHTVINGENYHALKALTYTHRGKVDAIYIDPPYNTGAKDWKYNNDYVEADDNYRHSKWLAMMERRLELTKQLLNPKRSVLLVTIDTKELHRLGLLLDQVFPSQKSQMITTVINPKGASLGGDFARVDEQIFIVYFGEIAVKPEVRDMLDEKKNEETSTSVKWSSLIRGGAKGIRTDSPGAYYPVFINVDDSKIHSFGEPLPRGADRESTSPPSNTVAVWPPEHPSGVEGRWGIGPAKAQELLDRGALRLGRINPAAAKFPISYLSSGIMEKVDSGEILTLGRKEDGTLIVRYPDNVKVTHPRTVWKMPGHNAGEYGSKLVSTMLPNRKFPFPKALYSVEDILRFFVADMPDAIILDFFAGSGTTAHAVMRLNKQDNGWRQCISVTNNEVSAIEQKGLREKGLRPGDPNWEKWGICDYITKPRINAAITGCSPDGKPIKGDYKFVDEFEMSEGFEENAEFFTLTYETPIAVNYNHSFGRIAPILWMRAGSRGQRIDALPDKGWAVVEAYGLLIELDRATAFIKALGKVEGLSLAYIVTDDDRRFQSIAKRLPSGVEPVRLYESYLSNFSFTNED